MNYIYKWVFPKIGVPQNGWFIMETLFKWMIWGYPYFWKHPSTNGGFSSQLCFHYRRVEKIYGFRDGCQHPSRQEPPSVATVWDACFTVHRTSGRAQFGWISRGARAERHINYPSNIEWDLTNGCPRKLVNG